MSKQFVIYTNDVTDGLVKRAKRMAEDQGANFVGDNHSGSFIDHRVTGSYRVGKGKLTLLISHKAPDISWYVVESTIRGLFY